MFRSICTELSSSRAAGAHNPFARPSTKPIDPPMASPANARAELTAIECNNSPLTDNLPGGRQHRKGGGQKRVEIQPKLTDDLPGDQDEQRNEPGNEPAEPGSLPIFPRDERSRCRSSAARLRPVALTPADDDCRPIRPESRAVTSGRGDGVCSSGKMRKQEFGDAIGLFQMRIARADERVDSQVGVFAHALRDGFRVADERRAGPAADQSHAGPKIGTDFECVAVAGVQAAHPLLADRIVSRQRLPGPRRSSRRRDARSAGWRRPTPRPSSRARSDAAGCRTAASARSGPPRARTAAIFSATWPGGSPHVR